MIKNAWTPVKKFLVPLQKKDPDRYHYFLWLKFIILNIFFTVFMAISYLQGWVDAVFAKNPKFGWLEAFLTFDSQTSFIFMMVGVFVAGWFLSLHRVYITSKEINYVKLDNPPEFSRVAEYLSHIEGASDGSRALLHQFLKEKWFSRIDVVRHIAYLLPGIGLLGTVIGFAIATAGVTPEVASDVSAATKMIAHLGNGAGVALYTTVVGLVLGTIWLGGIYQILRVGGSDFVNLLGEKGEQKVKVKTGETGDV